MLERFRDRTRFWIELPDDADAQSGIEERVISTLEIYEAVERCLVQSADPKSLGRLRALNPAVPLGALWSAGSLDSAFPAPGTVDALCPSVEVLTALADLLVGWRVDGIFTDRPGLVRARVSRT